MADQKEIVALQAENEQLRNDLKAVQAQLAVLLAKRPPSKAELQKAREEKDRIKLQAAAKRDAQAVDTVTIQKISRATGEVLRERVCARVDVADFEKQGWSAVKAAKPAKGE